MWLNFRRRYNLTSIRDVKFHAKFYAKFYAKFSNVHTFKHSFI